MKRKMGNQATLTILIPLAFVLPLFADGMRLFNQTPRQFCAFVSHRGENMIINGHGLFFGDAFSGGAQLHLSIWEILKSEISSWGWSVCWMTLIENVKMLQEIPSK